MNPKRPDLLAVGLILALAVVMARPLFGNALISTHGKDVFIKAVAMHQSWKDGDALGRWTPDLIQGYGYPTFNFYAPLFFYVAAALMFLPISVFLAFNMAVFIFLFLSGVSMYIFAREIWGRAGGLLSAVAYLFVPYHIVDLYVRGAIAEFAAFAFYPLIFWSVFRLIRGIEARYVVAGAAATAGLMLTHTISSLFFIPVIGGYLLVLFFTLMQRDVRRLLAGIGILAGGLALSAYFWIPAVLEKGLVQIERLTAGYYDYSRHFASFGRLLYSSWNDGMAKPVPVTIGIVHLLLFAAVMIFWKKIEGRIRGAGVNILFFALVFSGACFFMLPASGSLWKMIPLLSFAQFPWRLLICAAFAISLLAGGFVMIFDKRHRLTALVAGSLAVAVAGIFYCHAFGYQDIPYVSSREYLRNSTPLDNMEYLPAGVRKLSVAPPPEKLQIWMGQAAVSFKKGTSLDAWYQVRAATPAVVACHVYYFPGWDVYVNGRKAEIHAENVFGLISFAVPSGDSEVRVHFGSTPLRRAAEAVSVLTGLLLLGVLSFGARARHPA